jgi:hypothetical protein
MTDTDVWNLSPQQASERLAAMSPAAPPVDPAALVNIAAMSPGAARARLGGLLQNAEWQKQFLGGNGPQLREFKELSEKAAGPGDTRLDAALAYDPNTAPPFETSYAGELNTWQLAKVVTNLKELGLEPDHIREAFDVENRTIDGATWAAAKRLEQQRFGDAEYVKRYLAGNPAEKREMALIRIVLSMKVAEATATS